MARVRIYLPTYRRPTMLPRALASLRAQTCSDWVCEVHNDAPDDPTPGKLLASIGDARISLVTHDRNLGGTATFNLFFQPVHEPFTSILEDDNWWEPDFLTTMLATAGAHPAVSVFWANMHIAEELPDGSFRSTGRTIWPVTAEPVRTFAWGDARQVCGALHSNGAALYRTGPDAIHLTPEVPFAVIEPFRERQFPHPLVLVTRPLATFSHTRQTARSRDAMEWGETQAMLAATFLASSPWSDIQVQHLWAEAREQRPPGTTNFILAAIAHPPCRRILRYARWRDWWIALRGLARRPRLYFRLRRSRRFHADWWDYLQVHTARRWHENRSNS